RLLLDRSDRQLIEFLRKLRIAAVRDEQGWSIVLAGLRRDGNSAAGQLVENLGPLHTEIIFIIFDELQEPLDLPRLQLFADERQLPHLAQEIVVERCLDEQSRLFDAQNKIRLFRNERQRVGRIGASGGRGEHGEEAQQR